MAQGKYFCDTVDLYQGSTLKGDLDCQHVCFNVDSNEIFVFLF